LESLEKAAAAAAIATVVTVTLAELFWPLLIVYGV